MRGMGWRSRNVPLYGWVLSVENPPARSSLSASGGILDTTDVELTSEDRLSLLRFACAFAWADLDIADTERTFVLELASKLGADDDEVAQVEEWLKVPPPAEDLDPTDIDPAHRQLFLNSVVQMISADGRVDKEEVEILSLFEQLLP